MSKILVYTIKIYIYFSCTSLSTKTKKATYPEFGHGLMLLKLKDVDAFPQRMFTKQLLTMISQVIGG